MEDKNRIEASGTVKRTRKKTEKLSLSERLAALAEERALEARYAEQYRAQLLEKMSAEPVTESDEEVVAVTDAVAVIESTLTADTAEAESIPDSAEEDAADAETSAEVDNPTDPSGSEDATEETDDVANEPAPECVADDAPEVTAEAVAQAVACELTEQTEENEMPEEPASPDAEISEKANEEANSEVAADTEAQTDENEAEDEPVQNNVDGTPESEAVAKRQIKGYIAVPMYHYGMAGAATNQGAVLTADGGAAQPIFYPTQGTATAAAEPAIAQVAPVGGYTSPLSVDTASAVYYGEQYATPASTDPAVGPVAYGEQYADSVNADPTVGSVSLSEEYGSAVNAETSVDEVAIGETYSSPIDVKTSDVAEIPMDQGYESSELEGDRLAHDRGADVMDMPYSADGEYMSREYPYMTDIDHRPSVHTMDTIDLAADKIEENVLLIEQRISYEVKALKRLVKIHNYTFSLDNGAHYATTHELKYSIKQRISKLSKAKKLEKKAARRYYLATLDKYIGDVKKRYRNSELIASILRRLEFLMEERSRINQRLIALYSGKVGTGEDRELGIRQSNRAAKDMYKRQKGRAKYVSRLYVERDVKERILDLMNERTECAARIARIKRQLRSHKIPASKRRSLKTELREARRKIKYLGADIKHFIRRAELKHEHNSAERRQRIIVGVIVMMLGAAALAYLAFKPQIDAFLSNLF